MDWRTDPEVLAAGVKVDAAMRAGTEMNDLFSDSRNAREFDLAYLEWMEGRARCGDGFAASLGYGRRG